MDGQLFISVHIMTPEHMPVFRVTLELCHCVELLPRCHLAPTAPPIIYMPQEYKSSTMCVCITVQRDTSGVHGSHACNQMPSPETTRWRAVSLIILLVIIFCCAVPVQLSPPTLIAPYIYSRSCTLELSCKLGMGPWCRMGCGRNRMPADLKNMTMS